MTIYILPQNDTLRAKYFSNKNKKKKLHNECALVVNIKKFIFYPNIEAPLFIHSRIIISTKEYKTIYTKNIMYTTSC